VPTRPGTGQAATAKEGTVKSGDGFGKQRQRCHPVSTFGGVFVTFVILMVMPAAAAAAAARRIEPSLAIPMHWGTVIGSRADAEEFRDLASIEVQIPERAKEDGETIG
jgi:L-ascorbate metabolism protein UlaG (beta-lactamase superfamily)